MLPMLLVVPLIYVTFVVIFCLQTIGQAYEDMQTQNKHLLHQVTERDDYNIKVRLIFTPNNNLLPLGMH